MLLQRPSMSAGEAQIGNPCEEQRVVFRFIFFEWWRREKAPRSGGGNQAVACTSGLLRKQQRVEKGPEAQEEPTRGGSGLEEDCKMEFEEDIDCKKKLDERRKSLQKQLRDIVKFTDMEPLFRDSQKEWKGQLQDIERKRTELFPEHQKMQKRSRKLQCLQDKKRNFTKEACSCEEETRKASEEAELWQLSDGSR